MRLHILSKARGPSPIVSQTRLPANDGLLFAPPPMASQSRSQPQLTVLPSRYSSLESDKVKLRSSSLATIISWASILATTLCAPFAAMIVAQTPSPRPSASQPPADYDLRWGVKIPMQDKIELNATLYLPKTPVIFTLTPYISDTYHARGAYFASHGYAFALVDVRGRGNSGGDFEPFATHPAH